MLIKGSSDEKFEAASPGLHQAVLIRIIDIGTHVDKKWDKTQRILMFFWELVDERVMIDGEEVPQVVMQRYTRSLHEKSALRKMFKSWRGKDFTNEELATGIPLEAVLGKACQINVVHNEGTNGTVYANVDTVLPWPANAEAPTAINPLVMFDADNFEGYENLSDRIKARVDESFEGKKRQALQGQEEYSGGNSDDLDDSIPF